MTEPIYESFLDVPVDQILCPRCCGFVFLKSGGEICSMYKGTGRIKMTGPAPTAREFLENEGC